MSEFSRNLPYDEPQSDDDEAIADSGTDLVNRRLAANSGGGVATVHQQGSGGYFGRRGSTFFAGLGMAAKDNISSVSSTSDESNCPLWSGAADVSRSVPAGHGRPTFAPAFPQPAFQSQGHHEILKCCSSHTPPGGDFQRNSSSEYDESPRFWSPFGNLGKTATQEGELEDAGTPREIPFPSTFRLERTNFVVTAVPLGQLLDTLRSALSGACVDILQFKPAICVLECSFHVGNCFLGMFIRVFRAPDRASGELIDDGVFDDEKQPPFLVEVQHREGDRLRFAGLFNEIMREFKNQEGVNLAGIFRYRQRPYPTMGEGLALEPAIIAPPRKNISLLAEQKESITGAPPTPAEGGAMAVGSGAPPTPVPAGIAKTQTPLELDDDMMDDVGMLADMQRGERFDVQANAATAAAGLTTNPDLLAQLSRDEALGVAKDLAAASARLLVESQHRPARRQAAVVVANLSTTPQLREALLASDPAASGDHSTNQSGLVESLVHLGVEGGSSEAMQPGQKEEEIGTRRECMRALVGLAKCQAVRDTSAMKLLLYKEPSGRGATDGILLKRLRECRLILRKSRS